jgi:hypothetical protein
MKKEEMYNPEKNSSFNMMFGFTQPYVYSYVPVVREVNSQKKIREIKKTNEKNS